VAINSLKKLIKNIVGIILILVGIIGLFLPIIQGILLIVLGVAFLDFSKKDHLLAKIRQNRYLQRLKGRWSRRD